MKHLGYLWRRLPCVLALSACGRTDGGVLDFGDTSSTGTSAGTTAGTTAVVPAGTAASATAAGTDSGTGTGSAGTDGGPSSSGPGVKFDLGRMDVGGPVCPAFAGTGGDECDHTCTGVDIIFVIDNSVSMDVPQAAVAAAFPDFADAMVDVLPEDISLHVGVTSTEMGLATVANIPMPPKECRGYASGQPMESFYLTPDTDPTRREGAQGRLFPALGQYYFEANTSDPASIEGLKTWFMSAAVIGTRGSNIEMSTAAAGWVGHEANDATNAGFIRDAAAVLVVFFIQDEPDQSPLMINGIPGGVEMLNQLARSKTCLRRDQLHCRWGYAQRALHGRDSHWRFSGRFGRAAGGGAVSRAVAEPTVAAARDPGRFHHYFPRHAGRRHPRYVQGRIGCGPRPRS